MIPQRKQNRIRTVKTGAPSAALYRISCGLRRMELIIKAPNQSSRRPLLEKEAAIGMVPYMHKGEAIPRALETTMPSIPSFFCPSARNVP